MKNLASNLITNSNYIELYDFLELVVVLKTSRLLYAVKFIKTINRLKIAITFAQDTDLEPSRQWINTVIEKLGLSLETPQSIEDKRWESCSNN